MIITELLEMGEFFPEHPACPAFQSLGVFNSISFLDISGQRPYDFDNICGKQRK